MTGTGAYYALVWGIWLRHCLNGRQGEYELSWPSLFSFPDIVSVPAYRALKNGSYRTRLNGHADKAD